MRLSDLRCLIAPLLLARYTVVVSVHFRIWTMLQEVLRLFA